jgi:hypothetical protein
MKYLTALAVAAFSLTSLAALSGCEVNTPESTNTVTEPRDCDQPSRDEQGRPVDLC